MNTATSPQSEMSLLEHLGELRKRLMVIALAVCVAAVLCFSYSKLLMDVLCAPYYASFHEKTLFGSGPAEAFLLKLKVAFFGGVLLSSPVIFHQIWLFIAPGLYDHEKKLFFPFIISTTFLFLLGIGFCYRYVLPYAFDFFYQEYQSINLHAQIKIDEYLGITVKSLLGFGVVFEMPVLAFFLGRLGIVDYKMLISGTRYAVVVIFIIAAIFTPPDVLTQFLMAGPLLLLYGISILIVKYTERQAPDAEQS